MATAISRYRFLGNTDAIGPQLERNWKAVHPGFEKTYGNALVHALLPQFKVRNTKWEQRLPALRERLRAGPIGAYETKHELWGPEAWLVPALLHEAGQGPHPGTSMLEIEFESLPARGGNPPPKNDGMACERLVAEVLHDFDPSSQLGMFLGKQLKAAGFQKYVQGLSDVFIAVVRSDVKSKTKGTYSVLAKTEALAPFKAGLGKDECYGV